MQERKSNFELLRIISILMIIVAHYCYYGGLLSYGVGTNYALAVFLKTGGKLGVTCFVLITGYFMCEKKFHFSSCLKILFQTFFYSVVCFLIFSLSTDSISLKLLAKFILSPFYGNYWFVITYLAMYLFIPFLNIIFEKIEASPNRLKILFVLGFLLSLLPFLLFIPGVDNIKWFCYLYLIGAYCKKHPVARGNDIILLAIFIGSIFLIWASVWGISFLMEYVKIEIEASNFFYLSKINSPLMLSAGLCLFLIFSNRTISSKKINSVAKLSFALYLLHDNSLLRNYMWHELFQTDLFVSRPIYELVLHMFLCIMVVVLIAAVLETLRRPIEKAIFSNQKIVQLDNAVNKLMKL